MTDHLPECWIVSQSNPLNGCICTELRACEQRVRMEDDDYAYVAAQAEADGRRNGWAAGLDAAREAVAATFIGWCKDYMNCTDYEHVCGKRREIIAAIDALKEKR